MWVSDYYMDAMEILDIQAASISEEEYWKDYDAAEKQVMTELEKFCDEMCIGLSDLTDMLQWNSIKDNFLVPEWEQEN